MPADPWRRLDGYLRAQSYLAHRPASPSIPAPSEPASAGKTDSEARLTEPAGPIESAEAAEAAEPVREEPPPTVAVRRPGAVGRLLALLTSRRARPAPETPAGPDQ
ncbi:hypothetical protein AB0A77_17335 [Streptomyces varsoviensis]|uniref:hypothetical protein n=1 Tax=Streptomyces varsoviensis TaxID=67373 RepID=UPI003405B9F7